MSFQDKTPCLNALTRSSLALSLCAGILEIEVTLSSGVYLSGELGLRQTQFGKADAGSEI